MLVNSSSQTSIVNLDIPHLCGRGREREREGEIVATFGVSVHSEFSKIRAGCRLWELMGRRRHSLLFRISLILTELALASYLCDSCPLSAFPSTPTPRSDLIHSLLGIFMVVASFMRVYPTCRVKIR